MKHLFKGTCLRKDEILSLSSAFQYKSIGFLPNQDSKETYGNFLKISLKYLSLIDM